MTRQKFHAALTIGHGLVTWLGVYTIIIKKGVNKDLWSKKEKQDSLSVCSSHEATQGFLVVFI